MTILGIVKQLSESLLGGTTQDLPIKLNVHTVIVVEYLVAEC